MTEINSLPSNSEFERDLSNTIHDKTGEQIYINLSTENVVEVRAQSRKGSMPLGIFWVHVFQHPNNYPVYSYPYKKFYRGGREYELQLRVEGVTITINLASGQLFVKGCHPLDWFVRRITDLLQAYSSRPGESGPRTLEPVFTDEEIAALAEERERRYQKYLKQWQPSVLEASGTDVMSAGQTDPAREAVDPYKCLAGEDLETFDPDADLLTGEETQEVLSRLEPGLSVPGVTLYRLWRSVLNLWFSSSDSRVFLATPYIDTGRLADICSLFLRQQLTACLDTMVVPLSSVRGKFATVRRDALQRFPAREQVLLEYKVYDKVVFPVVDTLNSFLAVVKEGEAHVLHTNADFDASSFLTTAVTTVSYTHMQEETFMKNYLDPILK